MKTLRNHVLLYDAECPLCRAYTGAFIRNAWLDGGGREAFQQMPQSWERLIDTERAQSEIALLDKDRKQVHYGLDALLLIISFRLPWLKPLFALNAFRWAMRKAYFFISYNRKVIAAVKPHRYAGKACIPAFSLKYRIAYIVFAWLATSALLNSYSAHLAGIIPRSNFYREFLVCGGQIIFQGLVLTIMAPGKRFEYLGHMMTVSCIGAALLLPAIIAGAVFPGIGPIYFAGYFLLVVGFMLLEHARRMKILGLGWIPSLSWVAYRLLVLALILWL